MRKIILSGYLTVVCGLAFTQLPVSTSQEDRNVVLEEYTGIHCTYCPDGHKRAQQLKDNNPGDVILVNVHTGGYANPSAGEPDFRTPFGSALANQADLSGYPSGSINREHFPAYASNSGSAMSRADWDKAADTILGVIIGADTIPAKQSYVNVAGEATLDVQNRELSVTVEYYYTGNSDSDTNKLNIALLQNNIEGPQTGATNLYPSNILPNGNYNHQHMLRHFLTGQWGEDIINTTSGSTAQIVKTYTIPQDLNGVEYALGNLEVAAYIAKDEDSIVNGAYIPLTLNNFAHQNEAVLDNVLSIPNYCAGNNSISPKIEFTNNGEQDITSLTIDASINGGTPDTTNWSGNVAYDQTKTITLDPISTTVAASNNVSIDIINVNGNTDDVPGNNSASTSFSSAPVGGKIGQLEVMTDNYPDETTVTVSKKAGPQVEQYTYDGNGTSSGGPDALSTFNYTITFPSSGCYSLKIEDTYGDGLTLSSGPTGATMTNYDGSTTLAYIDGKDFNNEAEVFFEVDVTDETGLSVDEASLENSVSIYPNPFNNIANVVFNIEESQKTTIDVYNTVGQKVIAEDLGTVSGQQNYKLDGSQLESGVYIVTITVGNEKMTKRVTLSK